MTKQEFVGRVAEKSGLSARDAGKAVEAFLESIQEALRSGETVNFTGFGKFTTADRKARTGVNPRTGERVDIAAARVPRFSAGSALKNAIKGDGR